MNPEKGAKSSPGHDQGTNGNDCDMTPIHPLGPPVTDEPEKKTSTTVLLEHFRPLQKERDGPGVAKRQEDATRSEADGLVPFRKSPKSTKKTKTEVLGESGESAQEANPPKAESLSKKRRQHPDSPGGEDTTKTFGSAAHPRTQTEWNRLCEATDMETGHLKGSVGIPGEPLFTYEEAIRQRGTGQDLLLCVGSDIIPAEEDEFPKNKSAKRLEETEKAGHMDTAT